MSIYTQTPVITAWGRNPVIVDSTSDAKKTYGTIFKGTGFIIPTPCSLQQSPLLQRMRTLEYHALMGG